MKHWGCSSARRNLRPACDGQENFGREEQELQIVRRQLANFPEAMHAVMQAAHALRRPITEVEAGDVESWESTTRQM